MGIQVLGWSVLVVSSSGHTHQLHISKDLNVFETQFDRKKAEFINPPENLPSFSASFRHELAMKLGFRCRVSS
jgi:hypothetical protein